MNGNPTVLRDDYVKKHLDKRNPVHNYVNIKQLKRGYKK